MRGFWAPPISNGSRIPLPSLHFLLDPNFISGFYGGDLLIELSPM